MGLGSTIREFLSESMASSRSGESTREYRAVKRHYASLIDNLGKTVDPAHFARKLREEFLISESIMDTASMVGVPLTGSQKITPAIDAVLAQIKVKASNFTTFMSILRAENSDLADTLREYYTSSLDLHEEEALEQYVSDDVPAANSSEGDDTDHSHVIEFVAEHVNKFEDHFADLVFRLQTEMEEQRTSVKKFRNSITLLPQAIRSEHLQFIKDSLENILKAASIEELFMYLNMYWNFFDYNLLQHFVRRHGSEELKEDMEKYVDALKIFRKKITVEQLITVYPDGFRSEEPPPNFSQIVCKLDQKPSECTLEDLEQFRQQFCSKYSLPTFALMFSSVGKGSIAIIWHIPLSEVYHFHDTTIQWNSISTKLLQFTIDGQLLEFTSKCNAQASTENTALTHLEFKQLPDSLKQVEKETSQKTSKETIEQEQNSSSKQFSQYEKEGDGQSETQLGVLEKIARMEGIYRKKLEKECEDLKTTIAHKDVEIAQLKENLSRLECKLSQTQEEDRQQANESVKLRQELVRVEKEFKQTREEIKKLRKLFQLTADEQVHDMRQEASGSVTEIEGTSIISQSEAELTELLKEEGASPEFDFIEDSSSGQVRHKCTIKNYGVVERFDGGGYYGSKADAREQASLEALTKERAQMVSSRGVHGTRIHKERLKAYLAENKQKPKYITKETSKGFESTVFAPGLGYAKGEISGSRLEAEDNAACAALKRLKVEM